MGSDYKKEDVLCTLLLFGLILVLIPQFSSAQGTGCCIVNETGYCFPASSLECSNSAGTYFSNSCLSPPTDSNCTPVCCKPGNGLWQMMSVGECNKSAGTAYPGLTSDSCNGCLDTEVSIAGKVIYQDNSPASSAGINISNSTGLFKQTTANSAGLFSTCVAKNKLYNLTYYNPAVPSCTLTDAVNVGASSVNVGTVNLPCLLSGGGCLTNWTFVWDNPAAQCGYRTVINDSHCVTPSLSNKPVDFVPCITDLTKCGNGVLDSGEQCDPILSLPSNMDSCSDVGAGMLGTVSCSSNCVIVQNCFSCSGPFTGDAMCVCASYATQPVCLAKCSATSKINSFAVVRVYNGTKGIRLDWAVPNQCNKSAVTVTRCNANSAGTGCSATPAVRPFNLGSSNSYIDTDFTDASVTGYCYNLSVLSSNGVDTFLLKWPTMICTSLFDDECLVHQDEGYCVGKEFISCSGGKKQSASMTCGCGCRDATSTSPAGCVGDTRYCDICDICSGPFGLFAYPANNDRYYDLTGVQNFDTLGYPPDCSQVMTINGGYCYGNDYSRNKAVIGQFHSCFNVSSCYDYRTKTSCDSNPCDINALANCAWVSLTNNDELGLGVCYPKDEKEQDCTKCNELNILGNYCSPQLCALFGVNSSGSSTCYYNYNKTTAYRLLKIDNSSCMNVRDVACETYDAEIECVGSASGKNFSANVQYNSSSRIGVDNKYNTLSNDLFRRGKCTWNPLTLKCARNADSNSLADCTTVSGYKCFLDFANPNTTLTIFGGEIVNNIRYSADEFTTLLFVTSEPVLQTYYAIAPSTNYAYPTMKYSTRTGTDRTAFIKGIKDLGAGTYNIYFYSEDTSHNLEFVKANSFVIIPNLSGIKIITTNVSGYDFSIDSFLTNLTIKIDYTDDTLSCKVSLRNEENPSKILSGDASRVYPYLEWNYSYLPDGAYDLNVTCADGHLQKYSNNSVIYIEADTSISNPTPRGKTFRAGVINLSITTNESATCYYSTAGAVKPTSFPPGAPWTVYATTGGTVHNVSITESALGMKYYYSACHYSNKPAGSEWFVSNSGDVIYYAIDEIGPSITAYDDSDQVYSGSSLETAEKIYLRIVCDDSNSALVHGRDYSFGCTNSMTTRVYYENYPSKSNVALPAEQPGTISGPEGEIEVFAPSSYVVTLLDITAMDNGGNTNTITLSLNSLRNLSFVAPDVTICNPESGICN